MAEKASPKSVGLRPFVLIALSVLFFLGGMLASIGLNHSQAVGFVDFLFIVLAAFIFALPFFGYLLPFFFLGAGFVFGPNIIEEPLFALTLAPLLLSSFGGLLLAESLLKEFRKKEPLKREKKALLLLGLALVLALAVKGLFLFYGKASLLK